MQMEGSLNAVVDLFEPIHMTGVDRRQRRTLCDEFTYFVDEDEADARIDTIILALPATAKIVHRQAEKIGVDRANEAISWGSDRLDHRCFR